jgi:hypothetical protein
MPSCLSCPSKPIALDCNKHGAASRDMRQTGLFLRRPPQKRQEGRYDALCEPQKRSFLLAFFTLVPKKGLPTALHLIFPVFMAKLSLYTGLPLELENPFRLFSTR